jgi:hypothetical protein
MQVKEDAGVIKKLFDETRAYTKTNLTPPELLILANDLKDMELTEAQIITIPETVDDDALKRLVLDIFFIKT